MYMKVETADVLQTVYGLAECAVCDAVPARGVTDGKPVGGGKLSGLSQPT